MAPSPKKRGGASPKGNKSKKEREFSTSSSTNRGREASHAGEDFFQEPVKKIIRPDNQLELTEKEMTEEITRVLTANDPNIPDNITKYNYREKKFKVDPPASGGLLAVHFSLDGCILHKDSQEAQEQEAYMERKADENSAKKKLMIEEAAAAGEEEYVVDTGSSKNAFDFSERACQTFNNSMRDRTIATEPPATCSFSATVTQWEIFDSYMADYLRHLVDSDSDGNKKSKENGINRNALVETKSEDDMVHSESMTKALSTMERMINMNGQDEIFQDYKYWEDASDAYRPGEGSLLPLWRFSETRAKRKQVTALCWNSQYPDLFAVGYGSYDFMRQGSGMFSCFSLKNTSYPEYTCVTDSGIMCLDFHPQHPSLLAVGCYDGTVMVYDVRLKENKPLYSSSIKTGKHTDPVWQVRWNKEEFSKELNFYSISSDGRVASWIMAKNELKMEPVMQLKLVAAVKEDIGEDTSISGLAGGCCFDFNTKDQHLFLVGTEEGKIHKCSKAYSGQYLETYEGHHMAVYAVKWNPFHPRVFISCSVDWTVKLWDHIEAYPIMSFDLGNAVGDIAWSLYSSTVFTAVTSDGKVHTFDLHENKHEPLSEQKVMKRARLTHVQFNPSEPILIVGDDRGSVNSLKLSPNLRKIHEPRDEEGNIIEHDPIELQKNKMEKLLLAADQKPASS